MYIVVDGKQFPELISLVENKVEWIGGILYDSGALIDQRPAHQRDIISGEIIKTYITNIIFAATENDQYGLPGTARFTVVGERFSNGFDVQHGGFTGVKDEVNGFYEFITESHRWAIKKKNNQQIYDPWDL